MRKKRIKRRLSFILSFVIFFSLLTANFFTSVNAEETVVNPEAVIDIVVNVPADYPGTFLDFKDELTEKLVAEGMDESKFRILSSAIKIDTTETSGWYIYDHYNSTGDYNKLNVDSTKQPFRQADNSHASGANPTTIEKEFATTTPTSCRFFNRHISSTADAAGKAKMTFAGYGTQPYADFMIYPAANDSRRTFSFDIDAKGVGNHTLTGAGFFVNAGISGTSSNATVSGYLLFYEFTTQTSGNIYVLPVTNVNAMGFQTSSVTNLYGQAIARDTFSLGASKKARIDVDLQSTKLTVQQRNYTTSGTFEPTKTLFGGSAVTMNRTGYNGFGPMAAYKSHGCSELSSFVFSDLEMKYEASTFDALKNVQYSEKAEYKYFINLAGTSGDPGIPQNDEAYLEGIKRLNENKIFYVSNVDDGKVLTEPSKNSSGIGPNNGLYATDSDYVTQIAKYITNNYNNEIKYKPVDLQQEIERPIADFIIVDNSNAAKQVLTMHLQHLKETGDQVVVKISDRSMTADDGTKITGWKLKVYDPDNTVVVNSNSGNYVDSPDKLPTYTFNSKSKQGKYTFELIVQDASKRESTVYQTYLTAYQDDMPASIEATSKGLSSKARIALVDKGWGIDRDGVTLIQDQGSGVYRYQLNDDEVVTLPKEVHAYNFSVPLTEQALKITAWDECGNESTKTFETVKVSFEDDIYDPYYVLKNGTLGELPKGPEKENQYFQGWAKEDGSVVSSETVVDKDVVLHPVYTSEMVTLTFEAAGGNFPSDKGTQVKVQVPKGSMVIDHLLSGEELPVREGYIFKKWTYNGNAISTQVAAGDMTLTANWQKGQFSLVFDANGGNLGKLKKKSVEFGANILEATKKDEAGSPYQGTYLPTREGYTFVSWAKDKEGTDIPSSETMPASKYTVYAKWSKDNNRFIVSFDSAGGSPVADKSYPTTQGNYGALNSPSRSGYTFAGWYDEEGTKRESNGAVYKQQDHTLTARWTAKEDTQYNVEYYLRTDSGYRRADDYTELKRGKTDTQVSISEADIKTIPGYWYNEECEHNILSGTITGDGKMTLKLYYDRYLYITGDKKGNGSIQPSGVIKEGDNAAVTWEPDKGYTVKRVIVDSIIRDDLLSKGEITWDDVHNNHHVYVEFEEEGASGGEDQGIGTTGYFQVRTKINGAYNSCEITPTQTVKQGNDHQVVWAVKDGYYITSITVDGKEYDLNATSVDFKAIQSDHEVIVTTKEYPNMGGDTSNGNYTITVNQYGGNSSDTQVSGSCVVAAGDSKDVTWSASNGYRVSRVVVDGQPLEPSAVQAGTYHFANIHENHVVDVYFEKDGSGNGNWGQDMVTVSTQLIGGPGTITAGAMLEKGSNYTVEWNPVLQTGEGPDATDYAVYEIDKVLVNDAEYDCAGANSIQFSNLIENQDVKVYLKPVTYHVSVLGYGTGVVSESKTLFKGQSYLSILGTPNEGSEKAGS